MVLRGEDVHIRAYLQEYRLESSLKIHRRLSDPPSDVRHVDQDTVHGVRIVHEKVRVELVDKFKHIEHVDQENAASREVVGSRIKKMRPVQPKVLVHARVHFDVDLRFFLVSDALAHAIERAAHVADTGNLREVQLVEYAFQQVVVGQHLVLCPHLVVSQLQSRA